MSSSGRSCNLLIHDFLELLWVVSATCKDNTKIGEGNVAVISWEYGEEIQIKFTRDVYCYCLLPWKNPM